MTIVNNTLPVVVSEATGSESLVAHGSTGILVPPGATTQFAEALVAYGLDPALRAAHGSKGEARSLYFSWDRINQAVADTYLRLIQQNNARRAA